MLEGRLKQMVRQGVSETLFDFVNLSVGAQEFVFQELGTIDNPLQGSCRPSLRQMAFQTSAVKGMIHR